MKKILVPVDFSAASKNAAKYALSIAESLNAHVDLLHVVSVGGSSTTLMNWQKLEKEMNRQAEEDAKAFMKDLDGKNVTYTKSSGHPIEEVVQQFAKSHHADMIVVGTTGATGLKKALVGSNAASVINHSPVPVLAVPAHSTFTGIHHIVYATSMEHLDEETRTIAGFAQVFNARITIVNVREPHTVRRDRKDLEGILQRMAGYERIHFIALESADVEDGLRKAIAMHQPDLVALFTHELSLYEKIFGKGITRNLVYNSVVPLLAYQTKKHK